MSSCRYFKGDRPCKYYWVDRSWNCKTCTHHSPYSHRILLIKLDAIGDVIRSTPIAEGIKKQYPNAQLTWLTKQESKFFIQNNEYIDRIMIYSDESIRILQVESFDIVINLDKDAKATSLMSVFNGNVRLGYGLSADGHPYPINDEANYQYNICLDNWGAKQTNTKTYIEMLFDISRLSYNNERPKLVLDAVKCNSFKENFYSTYKLESNKRFIILNTGCGPVYPHKKWTLSGYEELISKLVQDTKNVIILTGSSNERERNKTLYDKFSSYNIINTTELYNIEEFCYLISLSDIVVTGDTMALHTAIALSKKIIAFFGPGPHAETDLFDLGTKMVRKELECLMCHDQFECPFNGRCMSLITSEEVYSEVQKLILSLEKN